MNRYFFWSDLADIDEALIILGGSLFCGLWKKDREEFLLFVSECEAVSGEANPCLFSCAPHTLKHSIY